MVQEDEECGSFIRSDGVLTEAAELYWWYEGDSHGATGLEVSGEFALGADLWSLVGGVNCFMYFTLSEWRDYMHIQGSRSSTGQVGSRTSACLDMEAGIRLFASRVGPRAADWAAEKRMSRTALWWAIRSPFLPAADMVVSKLVCRGVTNGTGVRGAVERDAKGTPSLAKGGRRYSIEPVPGMWQGS